MSELSLINEVKESIDTLGVDGVVEALQKARLSKLNNEVCLFVTKVVTEKVDIPVTQLDRNSLRSDKKKVAIGFCAFVLNEYFGYSHNDISKCMPFGLQRKAIFEHHKIIKCAKIEKPRSDIDKMISKNYQPILDLITNYKNATKNE